MYAIKSENKLWNGNDFQEVEDINNPPEECLFEDDEEMVEVEKVYQCGLSYTVLHEKDLFNTFYTSKFEEGQ